MFAWVKGRGSLIHGAADAGGEVGARWQSVNGARAARVPGGVRIFVGLRGGA